MPIGILKDIQPHHLPIVWDELRQRFGFNVSAWEKAFETEFDKRKPGTEKVEFFLIYGSQAINPLLNRILQRPFNYPTFLRLTEFVVYSGKTL